MSRAAINTLTHLIDSAEAGGWTLPADVLEAHHVYRQVSALDIEPPAGLDAFTAAAKVVTSVAADETVDLMVAARQLRDAEEERRAYDQAKLLLQVAADQAATTAGNLAADRTEVIITGHLAPALDDVHAQAREAAAALAGHALDGPSMAAAPTKVRSAYLALAGLVTRRQLIFTARRWINSVGYRVPKHDDAGLFAEFANPTALMPGWKPGMRPTINAPEDPLERLLWVVSDQVAPAKPRLATVPEQDECWQAVFGEAQRQRQAAALSARATAGMHV